MPRLPESNGSVQFSIRDAIVLFSLVIAAVAFISNYIAEYNQHLGQLTANVAGIEQLMNQRNRELDALNHRVETLDNEIRTCRP